MHFKTIIKGSVRTPVVWITCDQARSCQSVLILPWNYTCESPSRVLDWVDGHWTTFPCRSQRAQVTMVRLGGWITQLSHPRSDRPGKKGGFHMHCCVSVYAISRRCARTPAHACQEDLRGHWAALQAGTVSTLQ